MWQIAKRQRYFSDGTQKLPELKKILNAPENKVVPTAHNPFKA